MWLVVLALAAPDRRAAELYDELKAASAQYWSEKQAADTQKRTSEVEIEQLRTQLQQARQREREAATHERAGKVGTHAPAGRASAREKKLEAENRKLRQEVAAVRGQASQSLAVAHREAAAAKSTLAEDGRMLQRVSTSAQAKLGELSTALEARAKEAKKSDLAALKATHTVAQLESLNKELVEQTAELKQKAAAAEAETARVKAAAKEAARVKKAEATEEAAATEDATDAKAAHRENHVKQDQAYALGQKSYEADRAAHRAHRSPAAEPRALAEHPRASHHAGPMPFLRVQVSEPRDAHAQAAEPVLAEHRAPRRGSPEVEPARYARMPFLRVH